MIRSPLRYPGGKSFRVKQLREYMPEFTEYREPFVGGGSVFFYLKHHHPDRTYWINDSFYPLCNFWIQLRQNAEAIRDIVLRWYALLNDENVRNSSSVHPIPSRFNDGKALFYDLRRNFKRLPETGRAAALYFLNRSSFSGLTFSGSYSQEAYKGRFLPSGFDNLLKVGAVLEGVSITQNSYDSPIHPLLTDTILSGQGNDVFIFLDPPYFKVSRNDMYGRNGSHNKSFDHERFAELLKKCPHKWMLTIDDHPDAYRLFGWANVHAVSVAYPLNAKSCKTLKKTTELLITNYPVAVEKQGLLDFAKEMPA